MSYDIETTGLKRFEHRIFAYSTCTANGDVSVYRLDGSPGRIRLGLTHLESLWKNKAITKIMHNCKFDLGFTETFFRKKLRDHPIHDTYLMSHILRNDHPSHSLKDLCYDLGGYPRDDERLVKKYLRSTNGLADVPEEMMNEYQRRDAERTMLLFRVFWPKIRENKDFLEIYQEEELPLAVATIDIENRGVMLNRERCFKMINDLETRKLRVKHRAAALLEREINLNSSPQVREVLFNSLGYNTTKLAREALTESGEMSTGKNVLLQLRREKPHEFIELVLMFRSWTRGSTILQSYLKSCDASSIIHPNIRTCQAITGRESCSEPNLQNVEKDRALLNPYPVPARRVFRPKPGYVNFHIDYSGIEMRLLIHYSGDEELVQIAKKHEDVHGPTIYIFYPDYDQYSPEKKKTIRDGVKNANFAKAYGASLEKLASTVGLPVRETAIKVRDYDQRFPKLARLPENVIRLVRDQGSILTAFGRVIHVPRAYSTLGLNYLIQATAAEIFKRGQVRAHQLLLNETGGEMGVILPIHDELIIECPRKRLKDAKDVLRKVCKSMCDFPGRFLVPIDVEVEVATFDWSHKDAYSLE
jgi:DNA polymerase-1